MKTYAYILQKNNSIIKKRIKNPSKTFNVLYEVDNKTIDISYNFKKTDCYNIKSFLGYKQIIFYEHGNPNPLKIDFKSDKIDIQEISDMLHTQLFGQLINSAKVKMGLGDTGTILGVVGILVLGVIIIVSKFVK